jgi:hypothetical protein
MAMSRSVDSAAKHRRMNGWNRLFVIVAVCWAIVSPFLLVIEINRPAEQEQRRCADSAYRRYGASDSTVRLDFDRYHAEAEVCINAHMQKFVGIDTLLKAGAGFGDLTLGLTLWAFIVIPLCVLWIVCWGLGRTLLWVAAGFQRSRP